MEGCNSWPTTDGSPPPGPCRALHSRGAHGTKTSQGTRDSSSQGLDSVKTDASEALAGNEMLRCCAVACCTCNREMLGPSDQEMNTNYLNWHDLCLAWHAKLPEPR
jgi:hypothetical protein